MKKLSKLFILCSSLTLLPLTACQNKEEETEEVDPSKANFDEVIFQNTSVEYDGGYHSIAPVNLPINTTVKYIGQSSFTEVGRYEINIVLSKKGYNDKKLTALLIITYPKIKDVTVMSHLDVTYDGKDHSNDIEPIFINKPDGVTVEKIIKKGDRSVNEVIDVGSYKIHFILRAPKHKDTHYYSTLDILGKEMNVSLQQEHLDVAYNGLEHQNDFKFNNKDNIKFQATIKSIVDDKGKKYSVCKDIGEYTITYLLKAENHKDKELVGTMSIFDGAHIKNKVNNIQVANYKNDGTAVSKMVFMSLNEDGKLYLIDDKESAATLIYNSEVKDYKVTSNIIFIKTMDDVIKFKKINDLFAPWTDFKDQDANMDFVLVSNKYLVYTRANGNNTEICEIIGAEGNVKVLYSAPIIENLTVTQNNVYFLERTLLNLFGSIKYFPLFENQGTITPSAVNSDVTNVINFQISGSKVYYLAFSLTNLIEINSFNLFGTSKESKNEIKLLGTDIEYLVSGDELFYKYTEVQLDPNETKKPTKGIFKHKLNVDKEYVLLDTEKLGYFINEITLFDDQIYFSNKTPKDCHVYSIPSFGNSTEATLVR